MTPDPPPPLVPDTSPATGPAPRAVVKICGVTRADEATTIARLGADFVGLILAESPRRISIAQAGEIASALAATAARPVLVVRDLPLRDLVEAVHAAGIRWVQLHGCEDAAYVAALRVAFGRSLSIIKAVDATRPVISPEDGADVDVLLFDLPKHAAPQPPSACAQDFASPSPRGKRAVGPARWRAGGLTPESVAALAGEARYDGYDVAGGVELSPGRKDLSKVERFIRAVRG